MLGLSIMVQRNTRKVRGGGRNPFSQAVKSIRNGVKSSFGKSEPTPAQCQDIYDNFRKQLETNLTTKLQEINSELFGDDHRLKVNSESEQYYILQKKIRAINHIFKTVINVSKDSGFIEGQCTTNPNNVPLQLMSNPFTSYGFTPYNLVYTDESGTKKLRTIDEIFANYPLEQVQGGRRKRKHRQTKRRQTRRKN